MASKTMTLVCEIKNRKGTVCGRAFTSLTQLLEHIADWRSKHISWASNRQHVADIAQRAREAGL